MKIVKFLFPLLVSTLFACGDQNVQVKNSQVKGKNNQVYFEDIGAFHDVDDDGKKDLVFALRRDYVGAGDYYLFYKRNLGEGDYAKPEFLTLHERANPKVYKDLPSVRYRKDNPYHKKLMGKAKGFF